MNYTYDPEADALYIQVQPVDVDHQSELADGVIVDVASDGSLVGIDVMAPSTGWDPEGAITRFELADADAALVRTLASVGWFPVRDALRNPQVATGNATSDLHVKVLA